MIHSIYKEPEAIYQLINFYYLKNKRISKFNRIKKQRKSLENKINPYTNYYQQSSYSKIIKTYPQYLKINRKILSKTTYPPKV